MDSLSERSGGQGRSLLREVEGQVVLQDIGTSTADLIADTPSEILSMLRSIESAHSLDDWVKELRTLTNSNEIIVLLGGSGVSTSMLCIASNTSEFHSPTGPGWREAAVIPGRPIGVLKRSDAGEFALASILGGCASGDRHIRSST